MRLGEQKNIIEKVIDDNNKISIKHADIYGGQVKKVSNFGEILNVLELFAEHTWNAQDYSIIESLIEKYGSGSKTEQLEVADFNQLNSYVSTLNQKLPIYYSILETMVEEQDEKTINIKIPTSNISSLATLGTLNTRINQILKKFNVDGEFQFKGFDKGTDWYVITSVGTMSSAFLLACLKIAKSYFETKEAYFKSENARLDYLAALKDGETETDEGLEEYVKKRKRIEMEEGVKKSVDEMGVGSSGKQPEELKTQLIIATTDLIKELGHGTEFHMSLNPPTYAEGENQSFSIDYKKVRELTAPKEEIRQLESSEEDNTEQVND